MRVVLQDSVFQAALRGSLAVLCVVAVALAIQRAWPIVEALLISIVLATCLWPWVSRVAALAVGPFGWRAPRLLAAAAIYILTFATAGAITWVALIELVPRADAVLVRFPAETRYLQQYLAQFRAGDLAGATQRVAQDIAADTGATQAVPVDVVALGLNLFGGLVTLALVLVFTFFLLLDGHRFVHWSLLVLPRDQRAHVRELGLRIRDRLSSWVLAQLLYTLVSGIIVGLAMWLFQLPSPWLFGILGGLLAFLPGVGPALATIPALVVASSMHPWQVVAVAIFGVVLYVLDGTTISTKIYGEMLRLPMLAVLLALLIGASLMGVWGALIATPVAAAIQLILHDRLRQHA